MDAGIPPFGSGELELLPNDIQVELALYNATGRRSGMPCAWVDSNMRCSQYKHRPKVCRDFEVGGHECRTVRFQYGIDVIEGLDVEGEEE
jgi:Fe-S-cluster containining protein